MPDKMTDQPNYIELALEQAAAAMATIHETEVLDGTHHLGRYYFVLAGSTELYVAKYKQRSTTGTNATTAEPKSDFGIDPLEATPYGGWASNEWLVISTTDTMPAAVAVAFLKGGRSYE